MTSTRIRHPIEILFGNGVALASAPNAEIRADDLHGMFVRDTRVLSTYRTAISGHAWQLLSRVRSGLGTTTLNFQNAGFSTSTRDVSEGSLLLRLRRRVAGGLHDDLRMRSFAGTPLSLSFGLQIDADFADLFEVKAQSVPPRPQVARLPTHDGLVLLYRHGRFERGLEITLHPSSGHADLSGASIVFDVDLAHGEEWTCCVEANALVDGARMAFVGDPHADEETPVSGVDHRQLGLRADPILEGTFSRGSADLAALAVAEGEEAAYVAAGIPWFMTLFGRDSLTVGLMVGLLGEWPTVGALRAVGRLQAKERDDWRDAEPGKLPHEIRHGELASMRLIPHTPYYGAHDVPSLYCLALWNAWRWSGDRKLIEAHLETAMRGLRWCEELGDRDGDGLQEYATRSRSGYFNQSWKDAGDAILHEDGALPSLPIATVELQGYLFAARLAMAEILEEIGDPDEADRQRRSASELRALVEERFWLDDAGTYAIALDGEKRLVGSIGSNPGQLMWMGLPDVRRAGHVAARLLEPDLCSGWGLRTLSSSHPSYNPLSYQRGSVWPHDTILAAAGMYRYGLINEAESLVRSVLEAAASFEDDRLPELFAGFDRSEGPPTPYLKANVPQAWAASVPALVVQLLLGLVPDAPRHQCFLTPRLPQWLPRLEVSRIAIGEGSLDVVVARSGMATVLESVNARNLEVRESTPVAALWGAPP
jgi:glycogen debranching enzyme